MLVGDSFLGSYLYRLKEPTRAAGSGASTSLIFFLPQALAHLLSNHSSPISRLGWKEVEGGARVVRTWMVGQRQRRRWLLSVSTAIISMKREPTSKATPTITPNCWAASMLCSNNDGDGRFNFDTPSPSSGVHVPVVWQSLPASMSSVPRSSMAKGLILCSEVFFTSCLLVFFLYDISSWFRVVNLFLCVLEWYTYLCKSLLTWNKSKAFFQYLHELL